jgi:UDP-galactopyranose mutase
MAMEFSRHLTPAAIVYDCMDELSAFRGAPPGLRNAEAELFRRADLVFTGGQSLYESKKQQHPNVHAFPSSIDALHFQQARKIQGDPPDQEHIPHPRLGFAGVIDERLDTELLAAAAALRPDWHFVMLGPVVKVAAEDLPHAPNIHYLGAKHYQQLPAYMAGWDLGMLPFARNQSTRFISPTKTPEYLAAGLPVVSTNIRDVMRPYGQRKLAKIANEPHGFVAACVRLIPKKHDAERLRTTDAFLATNSWDITWERMNKLLRKVIEGNTDLAVLGTEVARPIELQ